MLLIIGVDFTTHGLLFKAAIYQLLVCSLDGANSQALCLSHQLVSVALHGSSFHPTSIYISDSVEHIPLIPKRNIPPDIIIFCGFIGSPAQKNQDTAFAAANGSKTFHKF